MKRIVPASVWRWLVEGRVVDAIVSRALVGNVAALAFLLRARKS